MLTRTLTWTALFGGVLLFAGCETMQNINPFGGGSSEVDDNPDDEKTKTETSDANAKYLLDPYTGIKQAIGVKDFTNETGYRGQWQIGNNLSLMLESALYDTNRFVMVEREKLDIITDEQRLVSSGTTAKQTGTAQAGLLRPAKYIATGAITQVEYNESGSGGGVRLPGAPARIGYDSKKAQITAIVKLIDTTTGEVVAKQSVVGKAGRTGIKVRTWGNVSGDFGAFQQTPLGEAAQDVINQAAYFIAKEMEDKPVTGSVVTVANGQVIINRGERHNYTVGLKLKMTEEGQQLIDPSSGMILGKVEGREIGTCEITRVADNIAYCKVITGDANPAVGTDVTLLTQ